MTATDHNCSHGCPMAAHVPKLIVRRKGQQLACLCFAGKLQLATKDSHSRLRSWAIPRRIRIPHTVHHPDCKAAISSQLSQPSCEAQQQQLAPAPWPGLLAEPQNCLPRKANKGLEIIAWQANIIKGPKMRTQPKSPQSPLRRHFSA